MVEPFYSVSHGRKAKGLRPSANVMWNKSHVDMEKSTIVFDGYDSGPGIKDVTHRIRGHEAVPYVVLTPQTVVLLRNKDLFANKANKQRFLSLLGSFLEKGWVFYYPRKGRRRRSYCRDSDPGCEVYDCCSGW